MEIYSQMANKIMKEQQAIIGPVALEQAKKVTGIRVDEEKHEIRIEGDEKAIIEKLVRQYEHLFGKASVEVCKEAIRNMQVPSDDLPALLK